MLSSTTFSSTVSLAMNPAGVHRLGFGRSMGAIYRLRPRLPGFQLRIEQDRQIRRRPIQSQSAGFELDQKQFAFASD